MDLKLAAFDLDSREYGVGFVVGFAWLAGTLESIEKRLHRELASSAHAVAHGQQPDPKAVQAALNDWRSRRGLISGDQLREWLLRHHLERSDLTDYLVRGTLQAPSGTSSETPEPAIAADAVALLADELAFEGSLQARVRDVAMRASAETDAGAEELDRKRNEVCRDLACRGGYAQLQSVFELDAEQANEIVAREASFRLKRAELATPAALQEQLEEGRHGLTEIEYDSATFSLPGPAREVVAMLKAGTDPLDALGRAMGFPTARRSVHIEDLQGRATAARLGAARAGECVGPEKSRRGDWVVYSCRRRTEATLEDPDVLCRLQDRLVARALAPSLERRAIIRYGL